MKRYRLIWTCTLALALLPLAACGDDGSGGSNGPILNESHDGWAWTSCDGCHSLPVSGHTESRQDRCAHCHGGNGALDPNHINSPRIHFPNEDCLGCHTTGHGYTENQGCVNCHWAEYGVNPG